MLGGAATLCCGPGVADHGMGLETALPNGGSTGAEVEIWVRGSQLRLLKAALVLELPPRSATVHGSQSRDGGRGR